MIFLIVFLSRSFRVGGGSASAAALSSSRLFLIVFFALSRFVLCLDSLFFFLAASVFLFKFSRVRVEVLDCVKACGGPGKRKEGVAAGVAMVIMIIIAAELRM